jgi:hypothetical protein
MILDDNLNNSQNDEYERLWVLVRLNNIKVALGVAYFPNDGKYLSYLENRLQCFL